MLAASCAENSTSPKPMKWSSNLPGMMRSLRHSTACIVGRYRTYMSPSTPKSSCASKWKIVQLPLPGGSPGRGTSGGGNSPTVTVSQTSSKIGPQASIHRNGMPCRPRFEASCSSCCSSCCTTSAPWKSSSLRRALSRPQARSARSSRRCPSTSSPALARTSLWPSFKGAFGAGESPNSCFWAVGSSVLDVKSPAFKHSSRVAPRLTSSPPSSAVASVSAFTLACGDVQLHHMNCPHPGLEPGAAVAPPRGAACGGRAA
mmetsp:Transcript_4060/g.12665  ORF Transcript_4060/g.12665 Transcript_4060/m.12665 type:complete len:259 (+) Transcript_4060:821-1597(+)